MCYVIKKKEKLTKGKIKSGVQGSIDNFWNNPNTQQEGDELQCSKISNSAFKPLIMCCRCTSVVEHLPTM